MAKDYNGDTIIIGSVVNWLGHSVEYIISELYDNEEIANLEGREERTRDIGGIYTSQLIRIE